MIGERRMLIMKLCFMRLDHSIAPVYDAGSRILILGSFPSVKSREQQFFYGNKQNRFWKVLAQLLDCPVPETVPQKKDMLLSHGIAVWDVIASCEITGSSDASIRDVVPNDLSVILSAADIRAIYANGAKSYELYEKYIFPIHGIAAHKLPSTSPANAGYSFERLLDAWKEILQSL
jgi:hypoxanthine-DNA glycosylase